MKFKVGDWVRHPSGTIIQLTNAFTQPFNLPEGTILWKPQEGEWCWFYGGSFSQVIIDRFSYIDEELLKFVSTTGLHRPNCEPFIGTLPSPLKENK